MIEQRESPARPAARHVTARRTAAALAAALLAGGVLAGCGAEAPPEPPSGDRSEQQKVYPEGASRD